MSLFGRIVPNVLSNIRRSIFSTTNTVLPSASNEVSTAGGLFTMSIRNVIRCHFPRPSERKRIKRHGWNKRMSTEAGRRVLMRRILKGRHVYSH